MTHNAMSKTYFDWLCALVPPERHGHKVSYKMLRLLFDTDFTYAIENDKNRAADGVYLRYRFAIDFGYGDVEPYLNGPCTVLEMMVALAVRCEEHIMDDPDMGNRTGHWFWSMIDSMGLGYVRDSSFRVYAVEEAVDRFLNRDYEPNGKGGLFTIKNCRYDLRDVEIWYQMCWYLDEILRS